MPKNNEKSLLRIVGEGSAIATIGNILLKFAVVASTLVILRYVSIYDYGLWQLVLSVVSFLSLLVLAGAEDVFLADLSREIGDKNKAKSKSVIIAAGNLFIGLGLFTALILFLTAPLISLISNIELTTYLRIASLYFILQGAHRFYSLIFNAHLQFVQFQSIKIINRIAYLLLLLLFVLWADMKLLGVVYAYVLSLVPALIIFLPGIIKTLKYLHKVAADSVYSLRNTFIIHGKWALLMDYANNLLASVRPWMIGYFLGIDAVAIFAVSMSLLGEVMNFLPLRQIFAPIIPRYVDSTERLKFLYQRVIKYSLLFYTFVGLFIFIFAPYAVKILFPQYVVSLPYFNILLLTLLALPFGVITMHIFYAFKQQKKLLLYTIIPKGIALLILPLFIMQLGLYWVAIVQVSASLIVGVMSVYILRKTMPEIKISLKGLLIFDQDDKFLLKRVMGSIFNKINKNKNAGS